MTAMVFSMILLSLCVGFWAGIVFGLTVGLFVFVVGAAALIINILNEDRVYQKLDAERLKKLYCKEVEHTNYLSDVNKQLAGELEKLRQSNFELSLEKDVALCEIKEYERLYGPHNQSTDDQYRKTKEASLDGHPNELARKQSESASIGSQKKRGKAKANRKVA